MNGSIGVACSFIRALLASHPLTVWTLWLEVNLVGWSGVVTDGASVVHRTDPLPAPVVSQVNDSIKRLYRDHAAVLHPTPETLFLLLKIGHVHPPVLAQTPRQNFVLNRDTVSVCNQQVRYLKVKVFLHVIGKEQEQKKVLNSKLGHCQLEPVKVD